MRRALDQSAHLATSAYVGDNEPSLTLDRSGSVAKGMSSANSELLRTATLR